MPKLAPRKGTAERGKGTCCLLGIAEWAVGHGSSAAIISKKSSTASGRKTGRLIAAEEHIKAINI